MDHRTLIFYTDELHDEFALDSITAKPITGEWQYLRDSRAGRAAHFFWYRLVATPLAFLHTKLVHHHTVVGREKLRALRGTGCFLYGNHTQQIGDAFLPHMLDIRRTFDTVVHANNVSMKGLGRVTPYLGALPLPDDLAAHRNFRAAIDTRIGQGHGVVIYPEAHIWPYYTGIRPFPDTSFEYPVRLGVPAFCFTNTYQKRRFSKKPRIVTYVDGPFYADAGLPRRLAQRQLRDRIHETMTRRADLSEVTRIRYLKTVPGREETQ